MRGEAGGGKTGLVRQLAQSAAERGVTVLYGACDAVVNAPYQPFVQALSDLEQALPPTAVNERSDAPASELAVLLPGWMSRLMSGAAGRTRSPLSTLPDR